VNNFDQDTGLHWYRRLEGNPDEMLTSLAASFSQLLSGQLGMTPRAIYWFEKADVNEASAAWTVSSDAQHQPIDNPIPHSCPYFRVSDRREMVHVGMAPFNAADILIQVGFPPEQTLKAIADECYHLYQDVRHGPSWRQQDENYDLAEEEAAQFAESLVPTINDFLKANRSSLVTIE